MLKNAFIVLNFFGTLTMITRTTIFIGVGFIFGCALSFNWGKELGYNKGCVDTILMYEDLASPIQFNGCKNYNRSKENREILNRVSADLN